MKRVYKCFETNHKFYFYDRNKNKIVKIPEDIYNLLCNFRSDDEFEKNQYLLERYTSKGFLLPSIIETIKHPVLDTLEEHLDRKMEHLILQITQNCNLRCSYCFYGEGNYENRTHSNKKMTFDTAKKAIDYMLNHSKDLKEINIGFYGGEPLLEMELIEKCVSYINNNAEGKKVIFGMTTNGTLLCDKNIEFLVKNDFNILISLDGDKEIHNKYRKFVNEEGSFDKIIENVKYIKDNYPDYIPHIMFNAVVSPENNFECTKKFFDTNEIMEHFYANYSTLADGYHSDRKDYEEQFYIENNYERFKSFLVAIGDLDKKFLSKLEPKTISKLHKTYDILKMKNTMLKEGHPGGPCIPGVLRLFVNAEGKFFPCEHVSESSKVMNIGDLDKGIDVKKAKRILNIGEVTKEECLSCWAFEYCTVCARAADDIEDFSPINKRKVCIDVKQNILEEFKNICALKELGYDFEGERL